MAQKENQKADPVADILNGLVKLICRFFSAVCLGVGSIRKKRSRITGLLLTAAISAAAVFFRQELLKAIEKFSGQSLPVPVKYMVLCLILLLPLFYLAALGTAQKRLAQSYYKVFADIDFKQKDKKYPFLMSVTAENGITTYTFKSTIPLTEWQKAKDRLETGLNCSIRRIEEGANKRLVKLITVSSDFKIPTNIPWSDDYISPEDGEIVIGENDLTRVHFNLNKTPHVICAGETGSGKSVILRCILWQMIKKGSRVFMIDFKGGVEFGKAYERYGEVITDRQRALELLQMLVAENSARLKLFRELEVKNLKEYNKRQGANLCRIGVFIDEIAEMLDKTGTSKADKAIFEQIEGAMSTLARLSRATGINLILGAQRPDARILTGQIKNNIPVRICGRFADPQPSEIVLNDTSACLLPDIKGRFIYKMGNEITVFQSYFFDDAKNLRHVDVTYGDMLIDETAFEIEAKADIPTPAEKPDKPKKPPAARKAVSLDLDFGGDGY